MLFTRQTAGLRAVLAGFVDRFSYTALPAGPPSTRKLSPASALRILPDTLRLSRLARLVVCTVLGLFVLAASLSVYHHSLPPASTEAARDAYIAAVLHNPVEGVLDPEPIQHMCSTAKQQPGLVWHCDTVVGGIGNVGNMWLNCMRYAIEAGATGVILPRLGVRAADLIDLGSGDNSVDLSVLFDVDYFCEAWAQACPQIRAYVSEADFVAATARAGTEVPAPHLAQPAAVAPFPMRKYLLVDPTGWRAAFDTWLAKQVDVARMSAETPVRVRQGMVLAQWNREAAANGPGPAFGNAFPRLFRCPAVTRELGAAALWALEQKLGRPVVADALVPRKKQAAAAAAAAAAAVAAAQTNHLGPGRLLPHAFMGVHMRVAADAAKAGWPGYDAQAPLFIAEALRRNLSTVYLATGSDEHRTQFRQDAAAAGLTVFTQHDLLAGAEEREALRGLTWDQQALVDFDVLLHSSFFYGFVRSSFSWAIALRRGTLPEAGPSQVTPELGDEYRDELSAVAGRHPNINPEGMWP